MRVLLDTHVVARSRDVSLIHRRWARSALPVCGKPRSRRGFEDIAGYLEALGLSIVSVEPRHVIVTADPEPDTRDPFDRMFLAQCQVEGLRLATMDRALANHPLALKT
jgi:PIN domain nuclease of toxin-antitoxin system